VAIASALVVRDEKADTDAVVDKIISMLVVGVRVGSMHVVVDVAHTVSVSTLVGVGHTTLGSGVIDA